MFLAYPDAQAGASPVLRIVPVGLLLAMLKSPTQTFKSQTSPIVQLSVVVQADFAAKC